MAHKLWSKVEDKKLVQFYQTIQTSEQTMSQFGATIGRTPRACINRAVLLGLTSVKNMGCKVLRGDRNPLWKGDEASDGSKRIRARRMYSLGPCERCGAAGTERHHKDANPGNNHKSNIMIVCRRCHMTVDGRLNAAIEYLKSVSKIFKPPKPCCNCGLNFKPLRQGRCSPCYQYFTRVGSDKKNPPKSPGKNRGFRPDYSNPRSARGRTKMAGL